jgi:hypothetical protein
MLDFPSDKFLLPEKTRRLPMIHNVSHCTSLNNLKILSRVVPSRRFVFEPRSSHVGGSVMDRAALGQVFSEYFGFP